MEKHINEIRIQKSESNAFLSRLRVKALNERIPLSGTFELTPRCSLNCKMCYSHLESIPSCYSELETIQWLELAKQAKEAGTLFMSLTGGEPLVHPGFFEICEYLYKNGFFTTVLTNATMIDEEFVERIKRFPPSSFSITLYGASDETYKRLCGVDGVFDRVTKAIRMLKQLPTMVKLKTTVVKENLSDMENIWEFAYNEGLEHRHFTFLCKTRNDTKRNALDNQIPVDDVINLAERYEVFCRKHDRPIMRREKEARYRSAVPIQEKGLPCNAGRNRYWINWKGEMLSCAFLDHPNAYPLKDGLSESFKKITDAVDNVPSLINTECNNCNIRASCIPCPAHHYSENNGYGIVNKRLCERTHNLVDVECFYETM